MGHDTHFLERLERLKPGQVELAFSLYRNTPLVKALLAEATPPGAGPRLAIALDDTADGPHVLVESNGHFVTCLAAGMAHDLPVITRAAVDAATRRSEEMRQAIEAGRAVAADSGYLARAMRVRDGPRLTREEARDLNAWAPALGVAFHEMLNDALRVYAITWERVKRVERLKAKHEPDVVRAWTAVWMVAHLVAPTSRVVARIFRMTLPDEPEYFRMMLAGMGRQGDLLGSTLRGIWATADLGESTIDDVEAMFLHGPWNDNHNAAALSLVAIGLRHPRLRDRCASALARRPDACADGDEEDLAFLARLGEVLARPEEALARCHADASARLSRLVGDVSAWDATDVLASICYELRPITAFADYLRSADAMAFVAISRIEDLYLPAERLARFPPENARAEALSWAEARRERRRQTVAAEPPEAAPPPTGRNEPCPCGSGKKFKKCCGG